MLIDAASIPGNETLKADVCIVGAGAAGISVAMGLLDQRTTMVILESGGCEPDEATQRLYQGTTTGRPYYELDACRVRYLGGSTNAWGGWYRPLDALDFDERPSLPASGWPFERRLLDPFYERAHSLCGLGPYAYEPDRWRRPGEGSFVAPGTDRFDDMTFQVCPVRFGREYRAAIARAPQITLVLHANAVGIEMDASHRTATRVRAATLGGNRFMVAARLFVLASGGIENPRLLLASRNGRACGVGNEHDLVGRYFTEHLHVPVGLLQCRQTGVAFYGARRTGDIHVRGGVALSECARRDEGLNGFALTFHNTKDPHDVLRPTEQPASYVSMRLLMTSMSRGRMPDRMWRHLANVARDLPSAAVLSYWKLVKPSPRMLMVGCRAEQAPNRDNRVTLDDRDDAIGMPRAHVHWQIGTEDVDSIRRATRLWIDAYDRRVSDVDSFVTPDDRWIEAVAGGAHHMGTTRMHRDPRRGVVNEHCRIHTTTNVYVAGSSVFPTGGWAPPTLTIVALALKLADHVSGRLAAAPEHLRRGGLPR
jgi:choline dehydrogenase-like flavoprotein